MHAERQSMLSREEALSVQRQYALLAVARSSQCYQLVPVSEERSAVLRMMDEVHTYRPSVGSRRMVDEASEASYHPNRMAARRLMRAAVTEAACQRPRTSWERAWAEHRVFTCLLSRLAITLPNQVLGSDVTYIPMRRAHA